MTSNSTLIETVSKVTRAAYRLAVRKVATPPRLVTNGQTDGRTDTGRQRTVYRAITARTVKIE